MIFVTVGTEKFAFDRLLRVIDEGIETGQIKETVFAQTGTSQYVPKYFKSCDFMPFDKMVEYVQEANLIVPHAGIGTILLCLNLGKVPIIFPRLKKLGEHLDDHQLEFARQIETQKKLFVAYDGQGLLNKIKNYKNLINKLNSPNRFSSKKIFESFLKNAIKEH